MSERVKPGPSLSLRARRPAFRRSLALRLPIFVLIHGLFATLATSALAGEGGASNYFPGAVGTFAPAYEKPPGLVLSSMALFTATEVDRTELQGRLNISVDTLAVVDNLIAIWTFEKEILGAKPSVGLTLPLGWAEARTSIQPVGAPTPASRVEDDTFAVGDLAAMPLSLNWVLRGLDLHVNLYEIVIIPSGQYDTSNLINMSRNYWSFDTVLALTWLSQKTGTEISLVQGLMANTENNRTDYRSGSEYHFDLSLNQYFSSRFALGVHVYTYQQFTEDQGAEATLGGYKGDSFGIGPQMLYRPAFLGDHVTFIWSWIRDLDANNRLKADNGIFQIVYTP